jgi:hypothetical protein
MSTGRTSHDCCQTAARRLSIIVGFALVLANFVGPASARAGEYVMRTCDVPGHPNSSFGPWGSSSADDAPTTLAVVDGCARGAGAGLAFVGSSSMLAGSGRSFDLDVPRVGPQSAIRIAKAKLWYAARLGGTGSPITIYVIEQLLNGDQYARPLATSGEDLLYEYRFLTPSERFMFNLRCSYGQLNAPNCEAGSGMPLLVRGMEITLTEALEPIVSSISGPLVAGGIHSGVTTVSYSAFDQQSGLKRVEALLGDAVVGTRDLTLQCHFQDFTVCPSADDSSLSVDTNGVPNGSYRLTVRVYDAAGNVTSAQSPTEVRVENHSATEAPIANAPASSNTVGGGDLRIAARFASSTRTSVIVPWGRSITLRGRLTSALGGSVGPAEIEVHERAAQAEADQLPVGRVQTAGDGTFTYVLRRGWPSRTVQLVYRTPGGTPVLSKPLELRVRAAATLRASLRGITVRYAGRVLSRPLPSGGKRVVLQGSAPGFPWATFARLRTNSRGAFAGTYRLAVRRRGVVLKIRAVIPVERGHPYLASTGRPVAFRVR